MPATLFKNKKELPYLVRYGSSFFYYATELIRNSAELRKFFTVSLVLWSEINLREFVADIVRCWR